MANLILVDVGGKVIYLLGGVSSSFNVSPDIEEVLSTLNLFGFGGDARTAGDMLVKVSFGIVEEGMGAVNKGMKVLVCTTGVDGS